MPERGRPKRTDGAPKRVATTLAFWGAAQLAASVLARREAASLAAQAAIAEWGASTLGVAWNDPEKPAPSGRQIAGRIGRGFELGLGVAAAAVLATFIGERASIRGFAPHLPGLALDLLLGGLLVVRDELLLRGAVLATARSLVPPAGAIAVCGFAAAGARIGVDGTVTLAALVDFLRGTALGAVWLLDRGAWMALAANAAWTWTVGPLTQGGLVDVRWANAPQASAASAAVLGVVAAHAFRRVLASSRAETGEARRRHG